MIGTARSSRRTAAASAHPSGPGPRLLRGIIRKRRELLLDLSQCAAEAVVEYVRRRLGPDCRPGIVVSIATAGDLAQWHPHGHLLSTDGGFCSDGGFMANLTAVWAPRVRDYVVGQRNHATDFPDPQPTPAPPR